MVQIVEHRSVKFEVPEGVKAGVGREDQGQQNGEDARIQEVRFSQIVGRQPYADQYGYPRQGRDIGRRGQVEGQAVEEHGQIVGRDDIPALRFVEEDEERFGQKENSYQQQEKPEQITETLSHGFR